MKRISILLIMFCVTAGFLYSPIDAQVRVLRAPSAQQQSNNPDVQNKLRQASVLERQGLLEEASKIYRQLYSDFPNNQNVYRNYLDVLIKMSDYATAEGIISTYLKNNPRDIESLVTLGTIYYNQNDKPKAMRQWDSILMSLGKNTRNYMVILNEMVRNGLFNEAQHLASEARSVLKQPAFYALQLGSLFSSRLNYGKAAQEYLLYYRHRNQNVSFLVSQVSRFPDEPDVHEQVIPVLQEAVSEYPTDNNLYKVLADYQYRIREYDDALKYYTQLETIENTPGKYRRQVADDFLHDGEYQRARNLYQELLHTSEVSKYKRSLYYGYAESGYQQLVHAYTPETGVTLFHQNVFWDLDFVIIPEEAGPNLSEIVSDFDTVVSEFPQSKQAHLAEYRLGEIYFTFGNDFDRARQYFQTCANTSNHPRYAEAQFQIGLSHLAKGDIKAARNHWQNILPAIRTNNTEIAQKTELYLAGTQFYTGNIDSGLSALYDLHEVVPFQSDLFNDILEIRTLLESGLKNKSASDTSTTRQFFRGEFFLKQHKITEAQKAFLRVLDLQQNAPIAPYALVRTAQLGRLLDQQEQVHNWLSSVIENYPKTPIGDQARFLLGEVYQKEGNFADAIHWYEQVLMQYPGSILEQRARQRIRQLQQQTS